MLWSYLKIVARGLFRRKAMMLISIGGLAIGMACALLLLLYVQYELSFDRYAQHSDRIFRLVLERKGTEGAGVGVPTPPPLAPSLCAQFSEITAAVRFLHTDNPLPLVRHADRQFYESRFLFADPEVVDVFSLRFIEGNPAEVLLRPNTVVITQETAERYFGEGNALGKTLSWNAQLNLEVTGVVQNLPPTSTLHFDFLASFATLPGWLGKEFTESWANNSCETYFVLSDPTLAAGLSRKFPQFVAQQPVLATGVQRILLQPLRRIHLYSWEDLGLTGTGDIREVFLFAAIAILVLIISSVSFFGLTTARLALRAREAGVRQVLGASKGQLFGQFVVESVLLSLLALVAACMLVEVSLPFFSALTGRNLIAFYSKQQWCLLAPAGVVLVIAALSGCYPALVLSSLNPVHALSGRLGIGRNRLLFWKVLVVFQCALAVALILGSWTVRAQLDYLHRAPLGFDKDHVLIVPFRNERLRAHPEAMKSRLSSVPGVVRVATAALLPGGPVGTTAIKVRGKVETLSELWVDSDFIGTIGATIVTGRDFDRDQPVGSSDELLLNEEAVRRLGWATPQDAIGQEVELPGNVKGSVAGVVHDFNFLSLRQQIGPLVLREWPWPNYLLVRMDGLHIAAVVSALRRIWPEFEQGAPFNYTFLNENFERYYLDEQRLGRLLDAFTLLSLFIAGTGLVSLIAFVTERRAKEISIRRVFGASVTELVVSLTGEVVILVLLSNVLAAPLVWYLADVWLSGFAFHKAPDPEIFLLAVVGSVVIALLTVAYRATKAALANPVEILHEL